MELTATALLDACKDESGDAGITIRNEIEPLAGRGAPVKPAIYDGPKFQLDRRWVDGVDEPVDAIVIDQTQSQANRHGAAMRARSAELGLPEISLDLTDIALPAHLPPSISSWSFPHRHADAYLRDSTLDGQAFGKSDTGQALLAATQLSPEALFEWFPQSLLYGFWQSHQGKKGVQTKVARSLVSEIVGYRPSADKPFHAFGLKGDPLNISVDDKVDFDEGDPRGWKLGNKGKKPSAVGHGQVPFMRGAGDSGDGDPAGLAAVSFQWIEQRATISLAGLRRIHASDATASAPGRALLVALGLLGHVAAFGRPYTLRSMCDLRTVTTTWTWLGEDSDDDVEPLSIHGAISLFQDCAEQARSAGLRTGADWPSPLVIHANASLRAAIEQTWPERV